MSEIRANSITDAAGTGAPNFPNGLESDGVAVATTADIPSVNPFTLGTSVASTSGTAIDFTGIPSWAKRITVMFRDVSFAASPGGFGLRLGTSSGIDTTSDYTSWRMQVNAPSTAASDIDANNNAMYMHFGSSHTGSTTSSGVVTFVNLTGNSWSVSGTIGCASPTQVYQFLGVKTLSGTLDRVRVLCFSSTFDAGTINISYEG